MSIAKVAIQFTAIDLLSRTVDKMKNRMDSFNNAGVAAQQSFNRMTTALKLAGISGILTKSTFNALKPAVNAAGELQDELLGIKGLLFGAGKATSEIEKRLTAAAFSIQVWTPFDITQIVALERQLLKSGATLEAVTSRTGATAAAAALAIQEKLDPTEAGKSLVKLATPFEVAAEKYFEVADLLSRAADISPVGAGEILETARFAAPILSQQKRTIEELVTLSAVLARSGIDASLAGTGLRRFFVQAAKMDIFKDINGDLKETSEIIRILQLGFKGVDVNTLTTALQGKEFRDINGRLKETSKILEILEKEPKNLGAAVVLERLTKMFGLRGAPIAITLMKENAFEAAIAEMFKATSLQKKMEIRMTGFIRQWESLRGTIKSIVSLLFFPALKPLTDMLTNINNIFQNFGKLILKTPAIPKWISNLSLGTVVAGGLTTASLLTAATFFGIKAVKGMGGIRGLFKDSMSTAGGLLKGKLIEKTTGIQAVFVTNFPKTPGLPRVMSVEKQKDISDSNEILRDLHRRTGAGDIAAGAGAGAAAGGILPFLASAAKFLGVAGAGLGIGVLLGKLIDKIDIVANSIDRLVNAFFKLTPDFGFLNFLSGAPDIVKAVERSKVFPPAERLSVIHTSVAIPERFKTPDVFTQKTIDIEKISSREEFIEKMFSEKTNTEKTIQEKIIQEKTIQERIIESKPLSVLISPPVDRLVERTEKIKEMVTPLLIRSFDRESIFERAETILRTEKIINENSNTGGVPRAQPTLNNIDLDILINDRDRVLTESSDNNTRVKTTVNRGKFGARR